MREVEGFEIIFSEQRPYLEGQELKGDVILDCAEDIVMENLVVEFCGIAELKSGDKKKHSKSKHGKPEEENRRNKLEFETSRNMPQREKYLNQKYTIYKRGSSSEFVIPAGQHPYPFRIQLPYNLPSSLVGRHGSIRYYCEATLTRPWQPKQTTRKEFVVRSLTDLAAQPQALRRFKYENRASYRLLGCLGHVLVRWRVDRLGYLPHESILIRGRISNYSLLDLRETRAVLYQNVRYSDRAEKKVFDRREVCKITRGSVASGQKDLWRETMLVPDLPPTGLNGCTLMELWYSLTLEVKGPVHLLSGQCSTDVVIGSTVGSSAWAAHLERTMSVEDLDLGGDTIDTNYFV